MEDGTKVKHRPAVLFRFRDEAQFAEVREVVGKGLARSVNEFIVAAVAQRLDQLLGPQEEQNG